MPNRFQAKKARDQKSSVRIPFHYKMIVDWVKVMAEKIERN